MAGGLSLQEIFFTARFDGKGAIAGIKKFSKQLKGLNKPINSLNKSFSSLFKVAGIAGLTAMTLNAAKLGREMGLISRKTGIAVENISSMQNAFAASGGDAKEVSRTLDRITTGLARVAMGDASFTSALASMGISAWEDGKLKKADKLMYDMADFIKQQLNAGVPIAAVAEKMKDAVSMSYEEVEYLSVGSAKLLEIQKKYNKEIGVLSKEESQALDDINSSVSRLRATVGVTFDKLISETAPMLETVLSSVQNVVKFVQEHKDLFGPLLTGLAGLSLALKALPALFTAISAHPLVALALASMAAGYAAGGGFSDPKSEKESGKELLYSGAIDQERYNIAMERLGVYKKTEGGWIDTETGRYIPKLENYNNKDNVPFPELIVAGSDEEILEIEKALTSNNGNTINNDVKSDIVQNFYGQADPKQVEEAAGSGVKYAIDPNKAATPDY